MPFKLAAKYEHIDETSKLVHSPKRNRVLANKDKDLKLTFTIKDKQGRTFTSVDSLKVETKVSDDSVISLKTPYATTPAVAFNENVELTGRRKYSVQFSPI